MDWRSTTLVLSGILVGCVAMRVTEPSSSPARAAEVPASEQCEWASLTDAGAPDFGDLEWRQMRSGGYRLKVITGGTVGGIYVFERCGPNSSKSTIEYDD